MKISIITAVFNNVRHIGSCLESVRSQTWPDIEHIIIDGGSTDGTLGIIERWSKGQGVRGQRGEQEVGSKESSRLTPHPSPLTSHALRFTPYALRVVSEPDNGIYDALNKGIRMATGDVVGFLHADDIYADSTVIEKVAKAMAASGADSCYGDLVYVKDSEQANKPVSRQAGKPQGEGQGVIGNGKTQNSELRTQNLEVVRYWESGPFEKGLFEKGWMPPHPTFFVRSGVYRKLGAFNTDFRIAADYELMLRFLWKNDISTCYIPEVLVKMRLGGASNGSLRNILRKSSEDYRAMRMHQVGGITTLLRKNVSKIPQFFKTGE